MDDGRRPWGETITFEAAAALAGRSTRTIYRWVDADLVRCGNLDGSPSLGVSELDVIGMRGKKWSRAPRLRHTEPYGLR